MPLIRALLETRRKAAAVRVDELEAELKRLRADLVDAEEVLMLRTIGLEQYLEALAEEEQQAGTVVGLSPRKPVGPRRAVPHRQNAAGVEDLSVDYQAMMAAAAEAGNDGLGAGRPWCWAGTVPRPVHPGVRTAGRRDRAARRRLIRAIIDQRMTASLVSVRRS
ncbi:MULTISPECIES: hypothetical protein [Streptomyces]|uniref:hypothetical protein n=1 Tax=Streptomyces TaxID=1883 RepID=UPI00199D151C|nr:hypothetical protein [Streptomyces parvulus]GGS04736.1 hypothetical protein GCM10010220_66340 [Streptomyces parvulus]